MTDEPGPTTPRLFARHPATTDRDLIPRWGQRNDYRLGEEYANSAKRLAESHKGEPEDDVVLLPMLLLYRHAIELTLKAAIRYACSLRRNNGEEIEAIQPKAIAKRLQYKHRHDLVALVYELDEHLGVLELDQMPDDARDTITLLDEMDSSGEAFRYTGKLAETEEYIDMRTLSAELQHAYQIASVSLDVLMAYGDSQAEYQEIQAQLQAEMDYYYSDSGW